MAVNARFYVHSILLTNTDYALVTMNPVTRNTEDNVQWAKYTPSGELKMNVNKTTGALEMFQAALVEGKDIAITFDLIDRPTK